MVGAGPGDAELITMKAVRCLREVEVAVYDRLADPRILITRRRKRKRFTSARRPARSIIDAAGDI